MATKVYLAVDLGAESGRVLAGLWNGKKLVLEEVHRFPNGAVTLAETIRWAQAAGMDPDLAEGVFQAILRASRSTQGPGERRA